MDEDVLPAAFRCDEPETTIVVEKLQRAVLARSALARLTAAASTATAAVLIAAATAAAATAATAAITTATATVAIATAAITAAGTAAPISATTAAAATAVATTTAAAAIAAAGAAAAIATATAAAFAITPAAIATATTAIAVAATADRRRIAAEITLAPEFPLPTPTRAPITVTILPTIAKLVVVAAVLAHHSKSSRKISKLPELDLKRRQSASLGRRAVFGRKIIHLRPGKPNPQGPLNLAGFRKRSRHLATYAQARPVGQARIAPVAAPDGARLKAQIVRF
jgi:hypothetical protein